MTREGERASLHGEKPVDNHATRVSAVIVASDQHGAARRESTRPARRDDSRRRRDHVNVTRRAAVRMRARARATRRRAARRRRWPAPLSNGAAVRRASYVSSTVIVRARITRGSPPADERGARGWENPANVRASVRNSPVISPARREWRRDKIPVASIDLARSRRRKRAMRDYATDRRYVKEHRPAVPSPALY